MSELKKHLIKIIHILKIKNNLDDESYRLALNNRYNKNSSKDLDINELRDFALSLGYKNFVKNTTFKQEKTKATKKQLNMIQAIWIKNARNPTQLALREFINNIIKKRPLHLWYLSKKEANKVILALKNLENSTH